MAQVKLRDRQEVDTLERILAGVVLTRQFSWRYLVVKRVFDAVMAMLMLVATAPLLALIAVAIKLDSPGPIFYRQIRIGWKGQPFYMYKFRSMRQDAEALLEELLGQNEASGLMFKICNDPRITRVGRVIRRFSLDELPQLLNVVEGTMSMVGPRPPLPNEVEKYQERSLRRLEAVPGMTGMWQVCRGPEISFAEMVAMDLQYIENWSLALDMIILLKTAPAVLTARGAY